MAEKNYKRRSAEERQEEIKKLTEKATQNLNKVTNDYNSFKEYLNFMSQFHTYSYRNQILLNSQYSGAKAVASFKKWTEEHDLRIRKGQKALKVFAPMEFKQYKAHDGQFKSFKHLNQQERQEAKDDKLKVQKKLGYKLVPVFDITQTNAKEEDYPKYYPNRPQSFDYNGDVDIKALKKSIIDYTQEQSIKLNDSVVLNHAGKGHLMKLGDDSKVIEISDNVSDTEFVKTMAHELAHEQFNHLDEEQKNVSLGLKEVEAEMTAYVVSTHFGVNAEEQSFNYMRNWIAQKKDTEDIGKSLEKVQKTSKKLIDGISDKLEVNLTREYNPFLANSIERFNSNKSLFEKEYGEFDLNNFYKSHYSSNRSLAIAYKNKNGDMIPITTNIPQSNDLDFTDAYINDNISNEFKYLFEQLNKEGKVKKSLDTEQHLTDNYTLHIFDKDFIQNMNEIKNDVTMTKVLKKNLENIEQQLKDKNISYDSAIFDYKFIKNEFDFSLKFIEDTNEKMEYSESVSEMRCKYFPIVENNFEPFQSKYTNSAKLEDEIRKLSQEEKNTLYTISYNMKEYNTPIVDDDKGVTEQMTDPISQMYEDKLLSKELLKYVDNPIKLQMHNTEEISLKNIINKTDNVNSDFFKDYLSERVNTLKNADPKYEKEYNENMTKKNEIFKTHVQASLKLNNSLYTALNQLEVMGDKLPADKKAFNNVVKRMKETNFLTERQAEEKPKKRQQQSL